MRLIDADKLYPDRMTKAGRLAISTNQIASAPTVEERPKGKWIEVNINPVEFGGYTCDEKCPFCGHITSEYLPKFCSHCGADMGGEKNNESDN